jgi:sorbitol/mannitol transport system permease protein
MNATTTVPRRPNPLRRRQWSRRFPLLPALIFTIVVTQLPFLVTLWYSLHRWTFNKPGTFKFIGLQNYVKPFTDEFFRAAVWHTVVITVGTVVISSILGTFLAVLLDKPFFGQGVVRTLLITPFLMMPVAASLIWRYSFLDTTYGLFNWIIDGLGGHRIQFTSRHPLASVVFVLIWQWTPFMMLITLSGLQSQTPEILEAARVDGASGFQMFRSLTLPHLRSYLELGALLGSIYLLQTYDTVSQIASDAPGAENVPYYIFKRAFGGWRFGLASAYGVVVVFATILLANFALRVILKLLKGDS